MVRKWSYLNNFNEGFADIQHSRLFPVHTLKVFRATTRLKKFKVGITSIVRKKYAKRKHKNNWVGLVTITRYWVDFFLRNKQFVRFYQSLGLFPYQSYSNTPNLFTKQYLNVTSTHGFATFACSKRVLHYFVPNRKNNLYKSPIPNTPASGLLSNSVPSMVDVPELNPGLVLFDKLLYPHNEQPVSKGSSVSDYYNTVSIPHSYTLRLSVLVYQINIYLTLINIKRDNS